jgi:MFS family permease
VAAALATLNFSQPSTELLRSLSEADWSNALAFLDHAGLTLIFCANSNELLPPWVRERFERNLAGNTERLLRLRSSVEEIARLFHDRRVEYLQLKGFSQEADYVADARLRVQYDIDLFAPAESLMAAREALRELGYEPVSGTDRLPIDHLAPMLRRTVWQWRGDYFDPDIPSPVDLHFRFWDAGTERIDAPEIEAFWGRRVEREKVPVLDPRDRLGYAALHSLRHLLRASVRVSHIYEIAYFLERRADNEQFWTGWHELHPEPMRKLESISFRFAAEWFGCRVAPTVQEEISRHTESVSQWFESSAASPIKALFHPNKRELWLHFALLDSARDRRAVFLRRVFPATLPPPIDASLPPERRVTARMRLRLKYAAHVADRALYHTRTLPPVLWQGLQWKVRASGLTRPFWIFLGAASLYNLGVSIFFLLYNLFLLERGYREDLLGTITAAFSMGNIAGVLPAANLAHRFGLKRAVQICFIGTAAALLLRATVVNEPALLATAFLGGLCFSIWAVSISPAVAALTSERSRPAGFSILFGSGIGLGIVGGLIGGRLPGWIAAADSAIGPVQAKQFALGATSALALIALWPLAKLALDAPVAREARTYPRNPFVVRFLAAMAVWAFATGALNPLFNAYLSRQFHLAVEKIGLVFSLSQAAQVAAVLMAPLWLRKAGLVRGVAATQLVTALCLALLAGSPAVLAAVILYAGYTSFQYMTEPGTFALLMNRVAPAERSGASALNFLVLFLTQALSASIAGVVVARFGYAPMLAGASIAAAAASLLFWRLLRKFET